MTKKVTLFAIFAFVATIAMPLLYAAGQEGSWTGEIIDVACHVAKGGKGSGHSECGAKCVRAGLPVGLLVGGTTYLLFSADHKPLNETLADHVGHTVTVTGAKYESAGANAIAVKDWKMAAK